MPVRPDLFEAIDTRRVMRKYEAMPKDELSVSIQPVITQLLRLLLCLSAPLAFHSFNVPFCR